MFLEEKVIVRHHDWTSKSGKKFKKPIKKLVCYMRCDLCGSDFERAGHDISPKRRNNNYKHACSNCKNRSCEFGWDARDKNRQKKIGQRTIDSLGYVNVYVGQEYPYSKPYCCSVREHIKVMEEHLGRPLKSEKFGGRRKGTAEVVHHIDGDKTNNSLDNLDLCTVQEHNKCHAVVEEIVLELYKQGQVGYDRKAKRYFLKAA